MAPSPLVEALWKHRNASGGELGQFGPFDHYALIWSDRTYNPVKVIVMALTTCSAVIRCWMPMFSLMSLARRGRGEAAVGRSPPFGASAQVLPHAAQPPVAHDLAIADVLKQGPAK